MRVGIFGGGFKPFTTGHFSKLALAMRENDFVVLYYAISGRKKGSDYLFTKEMGKEIFEIVKPSLEKKFGEKLSVQLGTPSPIVKTFKAIEDVAKSTNTELANLGIDPDSVTKLTIYSDPNDLRRFTSYIGTEKEERYFGNLVSSKRLAFDSGLNDEDDGIDRMISAMKTMYPDASDEELSDLINVRGSDVRAVIGTRDRTRISKYLPNFLSEDDKDKIIAVLLQGLPMAESSRLLRNLIRESLVTEGLEAHILNFYEDLDMPLSELYEVIEAVVDGKLEDIQEKMDGQNVTFSVVDGELQFFSKGANWNRVQRGGMNRATIQSKYNDRMTVRDAFLMAYDAINYVVKKNPQNANQLFQNGQVLVESALLAPNNPNTIVYEEPHIRFIQAEAVGPDAEVDNAAYRTFVSDAEDAIDKLESKIKMGAVPLLKLKRSLDADHVMSDLKGRLDKVISKAGLDESNTVGDLAIHLAEKILAERGIPDSILKQAAYRLVTGNKKDVGKKDFLEKADAEVWSQYQALEKDRGTVLGKALIPIENIIQRIGAHAFKNMEFALASNRTESGDDLRQFVRKVRSAFESGNLLADPKQLERIKVALNRVGEEELFEKSVEGIVFQWKGKTRKLTGLFTPINKLRGFFAYGANPAKIKENRARLLRLRTRKSLSEGGNAFKDANGGLTTEIDKENVKSTLDHFLKAVLNPVGVKEYKMLGSTGKKSRSGDLDIAVGIGESNKTAFKKEFVKNAGQIYDAKKVKAVGQLAAVMYPIITPSGKVTQEYVQIDIMFTQTPDNTEWMMSGTGDDRVKGVYRNLMLAHIAKQRSIEQQALGNNIKMTISFPGGLQVARGKEIVVPRVNDPSKVLEFLGIGASPESVGTFEDLVDYMAKDPKLKKYITSYKDYVAPYLDRDPENAQRAVSYIKDHSLSESLRNLIRNIIKG